MHNVEESEEGKQVGIRSSSEKNILLLQCPTKVKVVFNYNLLDAF